MCDGILHLAEFLVMEFLDSFARRTMQESMTTLLLWHGTEEKVTARRVAMDDIIFLQCIDDAIDRHGVDRFPFRVDSLLNVIGGKRLLRTSHDFNDKGASFCFL